MTTNLKANSKLNSNPMYFHPTRNKLYKSINVNMKPNNYKTTTPTPTQMRINFNTGRQNKCTQL